MSKAQQFKSKNNRPNFLWVYAIIGIIFMGIWVVTGQFAPQPEKINRNEVKAMLENQWVKRVVLVNDRNVEVSLKSQAELDTMASVIQSERDSLLTALSDSNASNDILTNYPELYLYGALAESAPFIMQDERINTWGNLYKEALKNANETSSRGSTTSSPLQMSTSQVA